MGRVSPCLGHPTAERQTQCLQITLCLLMYELKWLVTVREDFQEEAGSQLRLMCREDFEKEKTFQAGLRNNEEAS